MLIGPSIVSFKAWRQSSFLLPVSQLFSTLPLLLNTVSFAICFFAFRLVFSLWAGYEWDVVLSVRVSRYRAPELK